MKREVDMSQVPQNVKFLLFGCGPKPTAFMALLINLLAMASTILGVISAATQNSIGLGAGNWFLLAIAFFIWGFSFWCVAYFGAKEGFTE
jgi:hypothetical protein